MKRLDARGLPLALTAGLVFADATIVTLALPELLVDLDTTVYGVAAVLAVYTLALGCGGDPRPRGSSGGVAAHRIALAGSLCLFSLASLGCARRRDRSRRCSPRGQCRDSRARVVLAVAGGALAPPGGARHTPLDVHRRPQRGARPGRRRRADAGLLVAVDLHRTGAGSTCRSGFSPAIG